MNDEFLWIKPRYIYRISQAMKLAESDMERQQLKKCLQRGLIEWSVLISAGIAFLTGYLVYQDASHLVLKVAEIL